MKILAFDTTAPRLTVGLAEDSNAIGRWDADADRQRGNTLDDLINRALAESGWQRSDIGGIGLVTGPGSLTATRIGWATASGWAVATDIPIVGWSVQQVQWRWWLQTDRQGICRLTNESVPAGPVYCLIHHRGDEFYAYTLKADGPSTEPLLVVPGKWRPSESESIWIVGPALVGGRDHWVASLPDNANLIDADDGIVGGDHLAAWAVESLREGVMIDLGTSPLNYGLPPDFKKAS